MTAAGVDRVRFVFPSEVAVTPFNGRPLVANTRTTFLFRTLGSN